MFIHIIAELQKQWSKKVMPLMEETNYSLRCQHSSLTDRRCRQKYKDKENLNNTVNQLKA